MSKINILDNVVQGNNNHYEGEVTIGENTKIMSNNTIIDSSVGKDCVIKDSYIENSTISNNVEVGPYSHIKANSILHDNVVIGNYVEIKNSIIGNGTKIKHLTYVGDAEIGEKCNIGCGVIFVNYNGKKKSRIKIGDRSFIGSNVNLIAPLNIGNDCYICAGATVTSDLKDGDFVIGRVREEIKPNRAYDYLKK